MWMLNRVAVWWPFWVAIRVGQFGFQYPISNKESPSFNGVVRATDRSFRLGDSLLDIGYSINLWERGRYVASSTMGWVG